MLASIGNLLFQWGWQNNGVGNFTAGIVVAVGAAALWPPLRKRLHKALDKKLAPIHDKIQALHQHIEAATGTPKPKSD